MLHHLDKKSQKEAKALETAHKYVLIPCKRLITPVETRFAYLIHSLFSILGNKGSINYLYGLI